MKNAAVRQMRAVPGSVLAPGRVGTRGPVGNPTGGNRRKMGHVWELGLKNVVSDQVRAAREEKKQ